MTPPDVARFIVDFFRPTGSILEPCKGTGNFLKALPPQTDWCEITEGKDFFDFHGHMDWIVTNPPYSIYDRFLDHCFEIADNIVLLVPLQKAFKSMKTIRKVKEYGGLKQILILGSGGSCGFPFGFPVGCLHYQRGYDGSIDLFTGP